MNLPSLRKLAQMAIWPTSSSGTVTSVSSSWATTSGSGSASRDEVYRSGVAVSWVLWCLLKASRRGFGPPRCEMRTSNASEKSPGCKRRVEEVSRGSCSAYPPHYLCAACTHLRGGDDSRVDTTRRARESASRETREVWVASGTGRRVAREGILLPQSCCTAAMALPER